MSPKKKFACARIDDDCAIRGCSNAFSLKVEVERTRCRNDRKEFVVVVLVGK